MGIEDLAEPDLEDPYPADLQQNLIFRYEEPTTHSRWDKPLFTVPWTDARPPIEEIWTATTGIEIERDLPPSETPTMTPLAAFLNADSNDSSSSSALPPPLPPLPRPLPDSDTASIAYTIRTTNNTLANGGSGGGGRLGRPRIKPHQATVQPAQPDSGALYNFEKRTSAIVNAIRTYTSNHPSAEAALAQSQSTSTSTSSLNRTQEEDNNDDGIVKRASEEGIIIPVPDASIPVFIPAHIVRTAPTDDLAGAGGLLTLPRLQRLRRQWISQNRTYVGMTHGHVKGVLSGDQVADAFVRFLNFEFAGNSI